MNSFEAFGTALCESLAIPSPVLDPDERGLCSFKVLHRGAAVWFVQGQQAGEPSLLMMIEIGMANEQNELSVLRCLLESNLRHLGPGLPSFARDPHTGALLLCYGLLLARTDIQTVREIVLTAADTVKAVQTQCLDAAGETASVQVNPSLMA